MVSISSHNNQDSLKLKRPIAFYYGFGKLSALASYRRVVLQPSHYTSDDLAWLKMRGVEPIAYISLGEDAGPPAEWHRSKRNTNWQTKYVKLSSVGWRQHVCIQAKSYLQKGFTGFFLDTLDVIDLYPEDRRWMVEMVTNLRTIVKQGPLVANRGFSLMKELSYLVDAVVFEAFSTRWTENDEYTPLTVNELNWTAVIADELKKMDIPIYALDYADSPMLKAFAKRRAMQHGFVTSVSNRDLTLI